MTYEEASALAKAILENAPKAARKNAKTGFELMRFDFYATAIECIEKQIPKKPHITTMEYAYSAGKRTIRNCPYCYEVRGLGLWKSLIDKPTPYCRRCGQAIDWSEVE